MEHTKEEKLAALAFMMAGVTERIAEFCLVNTSDTKVVLFDDDEVTLADLIYRTQTMAREVLGHNVTVH